MDWKTKILSFLNSKHYRASSEKEVIKQMKVPGKDYKAWMQALKTMQAEGIIIKNREGRIGLAVKMGFISGTLQVTSKGFAFLIPDEAGLEDIFIRKDGVGTAMHKDKVLVRLIRSEISGRKAEGEVEQIIERANPEIVGTIRLEGAGGFVIPDDPRLADLIMLTETSRSLVNDGERVMVRITRWPQSDHLAEGELIRSLGMPGNEETERQALFARYGIPVDFSSDVMNEVSNLAENMADELSRREDLRDKLIVTIDGADAKDLDDAVSLEPLTGGMVRLGVHIADVSHFVKPGTALDRAALQRGTSVYLVDMVVPMLPPRLSNDLCSLNAGEDKLALSVFIDIDETGQIHGHRFTESVIHIRHRLTYDLADGILQRPQDPLYSLISSLKDISSKMRQRRFQEGSMDFDLPEVKVHLDDQGKPVKLERVVRLVSHWIIEECMLAANRVVAEYLEKSKIPSIYRIHEPPDEDTIDTLRKFLEKLGYKIPGKKSINSKNMQAVMDASSTSKEGGIISRIILQSMKRARYHVDNLGHFGLGFKYYTHFTSPIRRYPDLMVHRLLREASMPGPMERSVKENMRKVLPSIAITCSLSERQAADAEYDWVDRKKAQYMEAHLGSVFPGVISSVTGFGLFVELANTVEGLIHVSTMNDDYYMYDEKNFYLTGRNTRKRYRIGDEVQVQVVKADPKLRRVEFVLV